MPDLPEGGHGAPPSKGVMKGKTKALYKGKMKGQGKTPPGKGKGSQVGTGKREG